MIKKLTPKQESLLSTYREKWLKIGLSTTPADRKKAEQAAIDAYKIVGLEPPKTIFWAESPLDGATMALVLESFFECMTLEKAKFQVGDEVRRQVGNQVRDQVVDQVMDQVWGKVRDQVRYQVWGQIRDQIWDQVRDQIWDQVWPQIGNQVRDQVRYQALDQVWDQVRDQVGDQVRGQVMDQVRDQVRYQVVGQVGDKVVDQVMDQIWAQVGRQAGRQVRDQVVGQVRDKIRDKIFEQLYGQHDAWPLGYFNYMGEVLGIKACKKLIPLMRLAENCGWWAPYKNICILQEKHHVCKLENKKLHCETGPAIKYKDGFSVYALHGVRVPEEWIEGRPDSKMILEAKNAEQRMVGMRYLGLHHFLSGLNYKVIDKYNEYRLLLIEIEGSWCEFLEMKNPSTGETHIEGVAPEIKTVQDALAWRNNLTVYRNPEVLT